MVNWYHQGIEILDVSQIPEGVIGFVYRIDNLNNGKIYIGRKAIQSKRKRKFGKREIAAMPNKRLKKWELVISEMKGWKSYTGSSEELNKDIAKGDKIHKQILVYCTSKKELAYWESKYLFCEGTIESENYYNGNIMGKFFPKDLKKIGED